METFRFPPGEEIDTSVETCPHCGQTYRALRTGLTFEQVTQSMRVASDDPRDWRYRRRNGVLGRWREIKLNMWGEHLSLCAALASLEGE